MIDYFDNEGWRAAQILKTQMHTQMDGKKVLQLKLQKKETYQSQIYSKNFMSEEWINSNNCKVQQHKSMQVLYGHVCENNDDFHDKT